MSQPQTNISIEFKNNNTGHGDIILKLKNPKRVRKFDSYYFILDNKPTSIHGAIDSLIKLLEYWIRIVKEIHDGGIKYLPIYFSDEYLGVFKIENNKDLLNFEFGYTIEIGGYSISPSNPDKINNQTIKFKRDSKDFIFNMEKKVFIENIVLSIKDLIAQKED